MKYNLENLISLNPDSQKFPAIVTKDNIYSYNQLDHISSSFAELLSDKIKKGEYVGLFLDNSPVFIFSVVALWKIGAIPVPLNLLATDDELYQLFSLAEIKFTITNNNYFEKLAKHQIVELILFNTKSQNDILPQDYKLEAEKEAVVIFTSGATGKPKGVVHTFHSLLCGIYNGNEILNHQQGRYMREGMDLQCKLIQL